MYIWVAIDIDEQVSELRENAEKYMRRCGMSSSTFTIPFHISLKISFEISDDKFEGAVSDIRDLYRSLKPFQIAVGGIEKSGSIIWITMQKSAELADIHKRLDEMMLEKYGVIQHEFDKAFLFHTSVIMMNDEELLGEAFDAVKDTNIPEILRAERFIIGSSADGRPGTYGVIEEIEL